ncbi:MAG: hypothetical protein HY815_02685 [Candidatus Riflebacteria bacterium]|nr:hypothetical protein [Candidatus Riflebacteria bacterium]
MISIESLRFDTSGWSVREADEWLIVWSCGGPDVMNLVFRPCRPTLRSDLKNPDAIREDFQREIADSPGVLVSCGVEPVAGMAGVQTIVKWRDPAPRSLAMVFLGSFLIPFERCWYLLTIESQEVGTTGVREAVVSSMRPELFPRPGETEPIQLSSMEEFFRDVKNRPVRRLASDDEEFDRLFPDHPLSRVRFCLKTFQSTLELDDELGREKTFTVGEVAPRSSTAGAGSPPVNA